MRHSFHKDTKYKQKGYEYSSTTKDKKKRGLIVFEH